MKNYLDIYYINLEQKKCYPINIIFYSTTQTLDKTCI
jgi:hypothetical protein